MPSPEIEEFAKCLVQQVRDAAIQSSDLNLSSRAEHVISKRWKEADDYGNLASVAKILIPDIVDETLFCLLRAIDEGHLQICFIASNGKKIDLPKEGLGELGGWYMGTWRESSKERFGDNFSDLK